MLVKQDPAGTSGELFAISRFSAMTMVTGFWRRQVFGSDRFLAVTSFWQRRSVSSDMGLAPNSLQVFYTIWQLFYLKIKTLRCTQTAWQS
jgi:hypothetical protein